MKYKKKAGKKKASASNNKKNEIISFSSIIFSFFIFYLLLSSGENSGFLTLFLTNSLNGLFGFGKFFVPIFIFTFTIYTFLQNSFSYKKLILSSFIFLNSLFLLHLISNNALDDYTMVEYFSKNYSGQTDFILNGGLIGALFGQLVLTILGTVGSYLFIFTSFLILITLLTEYSIMKLFYVLTINTYDSLMTMLNKYSENKNEQAETSKNLEHSDLEYQNKLQRNSVNSHYFNKSNKGVAKKTVIKKETATPVSDNLRKKSKAIKKKKIVLRKKVKPITISHRPPVENPVSLFNKNIDESKDTANFYSHTIDNNSNDSTHNEVITHLHNDTEANSSLDSRHKLIKEFYEDTKEIHSKRLFDNINMTTSNDDNTENNIDSNTDFDIDSNIDFDIDSNTDFDIDSNTDFDIDSNTDFDIDSNTDFDIDSNIDIGDIAKTLISNDDDFNINSKNIVLNGNIITGLFDDNNSTNNDNLSSPNFLTDDDSHFENINIDDELNYEDIDFDNIPKFNSNTISNEHNNLITENTINDSQEEIVISTDEVIEKDDYVFPSIELLSKNLNVASDSSETEIHNNIIKLEETLLSFGVKAKVVNVDKGPTVTRYEVQPAPGVKVSKIANLSDDLALNLATSGVRIQAPVPNKAVVGIEVPNRITEDVFLREVLETDEFNDFESNLAFGLGKDIGGKVIITDIAKMPHMLIAGATGSGKSVCINTLITSIIYKAHPDDVKLLMIDPKVVELSIYNGIPHLLIPVVTDPKKASSALLWAVAEMDRRYKLFADNATRNLEGYNKIAKQKNYEAMPQIVIIIDELADLMMTGAKEVEGSICRLAQLARAAGIHLIIATQRPSVDVITGLIKANIPSRMAFSVSSGTDSRTVLDTTGAEKLLGRGDMLFSPVGNNEPLRIQGAFVSDSEVEAIVEHLKQFTTTPIDVDLLTKIISANATSQNGSNDEYDELFADVVDFIIEKQKASASMLQSKFRIGYNRASRIIDSLENCGHIGLSEGSRARKVLITKEEWNNTRSNF